MIAYKKHIIVSFSVKPFMAVSYFINGFNGKISSLFKRRNNRAILSRLFSGNCILSSYLKVE